ncbi:hypothetical protein Mal4_17560 [Maioricimonas rarisocia]|uniref:Uncharacterized protein n=1 Tax=Maioricimonas rarisocia TaxID=2528026 RepID=A0A517Z4P9_9PLAN|nr:hypothetical protein [Maioricimonas rarisocia]QDU37443.1 hypothetical protein Mal4_17560 [Maioricimonas rarisocia]
MLNRRRFLGTLAAATAAPALPSLHTLTAADTTSSGRKRMAVVTTTWWYHSHAWHMAERFLVGYPIRGQWHHPEIDVVAAYVDQTPDKDLSRQRSDEFGFPIYDSIAEALRCGGDKLDVDAVLVIGEHGDYPINEYGQKQYPRYEFFTQVADVFREDGRSVPVFNDKHLSWNFDWAKEMVETSRELDFPFLAGSSLPVTWRMPSVEMPYGAEIEEALVLAYGPTDIYDFHALETLQCMVERRRGGETGVASIQGLHGDPVWDAMKSGGWDPALFESCIARSQTLAQPETFSHRHPTFEQMQEWVEDPVAYRIEYADGLKATMLLMNGLVKDFTFAARLKGRRKPLSTLFYLPPVPNVTYSAGLMSKAEEMFMTGNAPYPVERTMLTSGMVQSALQSVANDQQKAATPHLNVEYTTSKESHFLRA